MDTDLMLVIGIVLAVLSIPSMLSALNDGRTPRLAAITLMIAGGLLVMAFSGKPGGYQVHDIPNAFYRVIAQMRN